MATKTVRRIYTDNNGLEHYTTHTAPLNYQIRAGTQTDKFGKDFREEEYNPTAASQISRGVAPSVAGTAIAGMSGQAGAGVTQGIGAAANAAANVAANRLQAHHADSKLAAMGAAGISTGASAARNAANQEMLRTGNVGNAAMSGLAAGASGLFGGALSSIPGAKSLAAGIPNMIGGLMSGGLAGGLHGFASGVMTSKTLGNDMANLMQRSQAKDYNEGTWGSTMTNIEDENRQDALAKEQQVREAAHNKAMSNGETDDDAIRAAGDAAVAAHRQQVAARNQGQPAPAQAAAAQPAPQPDAARDVDVPQQNRVDDAEHVGNSPLGNIGGMPMHDTGREINHGLDAPIQDSDVSAQQGVAEANRTADEPAPSRFGGADGRTRPLGRDATEAADVTRAAARVAPVPPVAAGVAGAAAAGVAAAGAPAAPPVAAGGGGVAGVAAPAVAPVLPAAARPPDVQIAPKMENVQPAAPTFDAPNHEADVAGFNPATHVNDAAAPLPNVLPQQDLTLPEIENVNIPDAAIRPERMLPNLPNEAARPRGSRIAQEENVGATAAMSATYGLGNPAAAPAPQTEAELRAANQRQHDVIAAEVDAETNRAEAESARGIREATAGVAARADAARAENEAQARADLANQEALDRDTLAQLNRIEGHKQGREREIREAARPLEGFPPPDERGRFPDPREEAAAAPAPAPAPAPVAAAAPVAPAAAAAPAPAAAAAPAPAPAPVAAALEPRSPQELHRLMETNPNADDINMTPEEQEIYLNHLDDLLEERNQDTDESLDAKIREHANYLGVDPRLAEQALPADVLLHHPHLAGRFRRVMPLNAEELDDYGNRALEEDDARIAGRDFIPEDWEGHIADNKTVEDDMELQSGRNANLTDVRGATDIKGKKYFRTPWGLVRAYDDERKSKDLDNHYQSTLYKIESDLRLGHTQSAKRLYDSLHREDRGIEATNTQKVQTHHAVLSDIHDRLTSMGVGDDASYGDLNHLRQLASSEMLSIPTELRDTKAFGSENSLRDIYRQIEERYNRAIGLKQQSGQWEKVLGIPLPPIVTGTVKPVASAAWNNPATAAGLGAAGYALATGHPYGAAAAATAAAAHRLGFLVPAARYVGSALWNRLRGHA